MTCLNGLVSVSFLTNEMGDKTTLNKNVKVNNSSMNISPSSELSSRLQKGRRPVVLGRASSLQQNNIEQKSKSYQNNIAHEKERNI